ncbi:hypothetical protein ACSZM0_20975 [Aeromonas hydrophila]
MYFNKNNGKYEHGDSICSDLLDFLNKNKKSFENTLIPDLDYIDSRAENINGIEIEQVSYCGENQYLLEYNYDWSVYRGCSDMDEYGSNEDSITFIINDNGEIEFEHLEVTERNTIDEF